jgi:hypothetical protein
MNPVGVTISLGISRLFKLHPVMWLEVVRRRFDYE